MACSNGRERTYINAPKGRSQSRDRVRYIQSSLPTETRYHHLYESVRVAYNNVDGLQKTVYDNIDEVHVYIGRRHRVPLICRKRSTIHAKPHLPPSHLESFSNLL